MSTDSKNSQWRGIGLVVVSAAGSGSVAFFAKSAYRLGFDLESILFWRFSLAAIMLVLLFRPFRVRPRSQRPSPRTIVLCLLMGVIGYGGSSLCYFSSLKYVPSGITAILLYTFPALVLLMAWIFENIRPKLSEFFLLLVAFVGCLFLVVSPGGAGSQLSLMGVLFGLGAALTFASYVLVGRSVLRSQGPIFVTSLVLIGSAGVYGFLCLARQSIKIPDSFDSWIVILALTVLGSLIPIVTMLAGIRLIGPSRASLFSTCEPLFTIIIGMALLGETLSFTQVLGSVLILFSLVVLISLPLLNHPSSKRLTLKPAVLTDRHNN